MQVELTLASLLVLASCATPGKVAPARQWNAADYFPVAQGNAWAYRVTKATPQGDQTVLVTSQITEVSATEVSVKSGDEVIRYERRPDGLFKPKSGYYLIKDPIAAGAKWAMPDGGEVRIEAIDAEEKVTAGTFSRCILVVEEIANEQRAEWVYAPDVGAVRMRFLDLTTNPPSTILSGELTGYQVAPPPGQSPGS